MRIVSWNVENLARWLEDGTVEVLGRGNVATLCQRLHAASSRQA